jgi:hypothetical protein
MDSVGLISQRRTLRDVLRDLEDPELVALGGEPLRGSGFEDEVDRPERIGARLEGER